MTSDFQTVRGVGELAMSTTTWRDQTHIFLDFYFSTFRGSFRIKESSTFATMMGVGSTNKDEVKYVNELQQENHRRE